MSLGWKLACGGIQVDILETSEIVGGLAASIRSNGYCLDFGPHSFFSEDKEIVQTGLKFFNNQLKPRPREVKFYYKGKYLDYPLTAYNVLFQMGMVSGIKATLSFMKSKLTIKGRPASSENDESVEDWAIASFGEHLYKTFFKPYTEQFWKVPCAELSSRAIPSHTRMSFINTCRLLLHRKVSKKGDSLIERETLPTYYPNQGFGEIPERMTKAIKDEGGNVHLGCEPIEVLKLRNGKMRVTYMEKGLEKRIEGSTVISTIPLNLLAKILKPTPPPEIIESAEKLYYQGLVVLGLVTEKQDILKCHYMYMMNRLYNRISEMNKFSTATSPSKDNIIALEFTCHRESALWKVSKEELFEMSIGTLTEDGFLSKEDVKELLLIKAPYAYPIYRKDYAGHLKRLLDYVHEYEGLTTLGRTGEFMYMDVDKCMRRAFDYVNDFLKENREKTPYHTTQESY